MDTPLVEKEEIPQAVKIAIEAARKYWDGWSNNVPEIDGEYHPLVHAFLQVYNNALEIAAGDADAAIQKSKDWDSSYWDQCAQFIGVTIRKRKGNFSKCQMTTAKN